MVSENERKKEKRHSLCLRTTQLVAAGLSLFQAKPEPSTTTTTEAHTAASICQNRLFRNLLKQTNLFR